MDEKLPDYYKVLLFLTSCAASFGRVKPIHISGSISKGSQIHPVRLSTNTGLNAHVITCNHMYNTYSCNTYAAVKELTCQVLGLSSDAEIDAIKKAYRQLALKWHPDKNDAWIGGVTTGDAW